MSDDEMGDSKKNKGGQVAEKLIAGLEGQKPGEEVSVVTRAHEEMRVIYAEKGKGLSPHEEKLKRAQLEEQLAAVARGSARSSELGDMLQEGVREIDESLEQADRSIGSVIDKNQFPPSVSDGVDVELDTQELFVEVPNEESGVSRVVAANVPLGGRVGTMDIRFEESVEISAGRVRDSKSSARVPSTLIAPSALNPAYTHAQVPAYSTQTSALQTSQTRQTTSAKVAVDSTPTPGFDGTDFRENYTAIHSSNRMARLAGVLGAAAVLESGVAAYLWNELDKETTKPLPGKILNLDGKTINLSEAFIRDGQILVDVRDIPFLLKYNSPLKTAASRDGRRLNVNESGLEKAIAIDGLRSSYNDMVIYHAPTGTDVYPIDNGKVLHSGPLVLGERNFGKTVVVEHQDRTIGVYGNLSDFRPNPGDLVETKNRLGWVGNSAHLFEGTKGSQPYALVVLIYKPGSTFKDGVLRGEAYPSSTITQLFARGIVSEQIDLRTEKLTRQ